MSSGETMTRYRPGTLLALLLICLLPQVAPAVEDEAGKAAATAGGFVALLDRKDAGEAWRQLTPFARITKTPEQWQGLHRALRSAYGPLEKRILRGVTLQNRYAMLPDGRFAIVQFDTIFSGKRAAVETIVLALEKDGRWLVHDYVIN